MPLDTRFEFLPNGNVLVIANGLKTTSEAIAAGRDLSRIGNEGLWEEMLFDAGVRTPSVGFSDEGDASLR